MIDDPGWSLDRLTQTLRVYWARTLEQHWPRLRALLEGDVLYSAKQLALEGARGLFGDVHPEVTWRDGVLTIDKRHRPRRSPEVEGWC